MTEGILKAVKDWCRGKFQVKGEYVTETELAEKNYATKDELPGDTGITAEAVRELIDASSRENMGGAKIAQDAEGNWGLVVPGDDAVIPFSGDKTQIVGGTNMAGLETVTVSVECNFYEGCEQVTA